MKKINEFTILGKVVNLIEHDIPLPAIRQVSGFSKRLVEKYYSLYQKYNSKDFLFPMAKIRRFGHAQKKRKEGDSKDEDG